MRCRAVVVGIDKYVHNPLTSAVRDAKAFANRLETLGLARRQEIRLLLDEQATRRGLSAVLKSVYDDWEGLDRLVFYFSGHGLLAPVDPARSVYSTALMPVDVKDLALDCSLLINLDELQARLRRAGPPEQYLFVDACRDLAFAEAPGNLASLGWPASPRPSGPPNAQAVLHAVAPGSRARGVRGGLGSFTGDLLSALSADSRAATWSDEHGAYVVTMESLRDHLRAKARARLSGQTLWNRSYMLPELTVADPSPSPLLSEVDPPRGTLRIDVEPKESADSTLVWLARQRNDLAAPRWPPTKCGEAVRIEPQRYELLARGRTGEAVPHPRWIDGREDTDAVVRVLGHGEMYHEPRSPDGPGTAVVRTGGPTRAGDPAEVGRIRLTGVDPRTVTTVHRLEPPGVVAEEVGAADLPLSSGFHRVEMRLGPETLSSVETEVRIGQVLDIRPTAPSTPLTRALEEFRYPFGLMGDDVDTMPATVTAAAVLSSMALLERRGSGHSSPTAADGRPLRLRVAVAVEGEDEEWDHRCATVLRSLSCRVRDALTGDTPVPLQEVDGRFEPPRTALGALEPPGASFTLIVQSRHTGRIEIPTAAAWGHVTVVTLILRPDGTLDLGQHLLPLMGDRPVFAEDPGVLVRLLRELHVARALFATRELIGVGDTVREQPPYDLLRGTPVDPLVACMAYYAWRDAVPQGDPEAALQAFLHADRLARDFPELPDAWAIAALDRSLDPSDRHRDGPALLARSTAVLGTRSTRLGRPAEPAPRTVWSARWHPPTG